VTGALYFGANVSRKSCSQPGSAVTSGVSLGTVVVGIMTGVEVGGARGMSSGRSVPGVTELVGVGGTPNTRHRGSPRLGLLCFYPRPGRLQTAGVAVDDPETFDQGVQFAQSVAVKSAG